MYGRSQMSQTDAPVLVIGGRTTGLMMASELARWGLAVRIVDQSPGIDPHVRANLLHSRTLEIFRTLGIAEQATRGSIAEHGLRIHAQNQFVGAHRHAPVDSPFPYGMSQSQAVTEAVLERHLQTFDVEVERRVSLRDLTDKGDHVVATLEHEDGRIETVEAPWLIGCDGAHSTVRHLTDCAFPGEEDPHPYILGDVVVEGDLADHEGYVFLHDDGDYFIFSMLPEERRLVCATVPAGYPAGKPPTLEELQALLDKRGVPGFRLVDPRWLAHFHIHYRLAPHYRKGRTFLAGDAAHVHSLLAGQGMNTGIQDAYNLAWKLALVTRGIAPEWWLDTYEDERRSVGGHVVAMTKELTDTVEVFGALSESERERVVANMFVPDARKIAAARELQELDLDYGSSDLCQEGDGFRGGPRAGTEAPESTGLAVDGEAQTVFDLFGTPKFRLFLFTEPDTLDQAPSSTRALWETHQTWIDTFAVSKTPFATPAGVTMLHDPDGTMHERYDAIAPTLYLVRPDGYIAFRDRGFDRVGDFLSQITGDTPR